MKRTVPALWFGLVLAAGCERSQPAAPLMDNESFTGPVFAADLAAVAAGWQLEIVADLDQSYAGWDVDLGDADNDGLCDLLATGAPDSRLYLSSWRDGAWSTRLVADRLAGSSPGLGLAVRVADLDGDGRREVLVGTGQEDGSTARLHLLRIEGPAVQRLALAQPAINRSSYTHGLAVADLDGDGTAEVWSAYCGNGEVIRYDAAAGLGAIAARKVRQLPGSGEESLLADVDNDGREELLLVSAYRDGAARIEIHEMAENGELAGEPRLVLAGFDGQACFYASIAVGDVDNDGLNELVVGWKREQAVARATLLAYRVGDQALVSHEFARETADLDLAYFEKMMVVADADNDGLNELIVTTRGDGASEGVTSARLGHVFRYDAQPTGAVTSTLLVDFDERFVESSWPAVGDVDDDGRNEIVLATGRGDRRLPGRSWLVVVRHP